MEKLECHESGAFSRLRLFGKANTFWAFFSQVLDADGGCQEVVRKIQAFAASHSCCTPSASTSAYCQARSKLDADSLEAVLAHTADRLERRGRSRSWKGRRVVVVDGTCVSMPDTPANQEVWPQSGTQKPGCGFPLARISACFCLQSGGLLSHRIGNLRTHELSLLRHQWESFEAGDVFLGDKAYCSFYDIWQLQQRGVEAVITLARRKPVDAASAITVLGKDDLLIRWPKPAWNKNKSYSEEEWQALPDHLTLRQIKVTVDSPGFRVQTFYIVTTLIDVETYSAADLTDLYYQRWDVELFLRDIKTTMGMDILRCLTPAMVTKEILMHFIAYNAIRLLMFEAANMTDQTPRRISFKASLQALRHWEPLFNRAGLKDLERRRLIASLHQAIAASIVIERPGRREPRCVKRRPKPFPLLTAPRHQITGAIYRSRSHENHP